MPGNTRAYSCRSRTSACIDMYSCCALLCLIDLAINYEQVANNRGFLDLDRCRLFSFRPRELDRAQMCLTQHCRGFCWWIRVTWKSRATGIRKPGFCMDRLQKFLTTALIADVRCVGFTSVSFKVRAPGCGAGNRGHATMVQPLDVMLYHLRRRWLVHHGRSILGLPLSEYSSASL